MNEIKCPKCGEVFTIDEGLYAEIAEKVRKETIEEERKAKEEALKAKEEALRIKYDSELKLAKQNGELDKEKALAEKEARLKELEFKLEGAEKDKKDAIAFELAKKDAIIAGLKGDLEAAKKDTEIEVSKALAEEQKKSNSLEIEKEELLGKLGIQEEQAKTNIQLIEEKYKEIIRIKDEDIAHYKDLKAKLSTKAIGESLEQYCLNEFNKIRAYVYPRAHFGKDNDIVEGTKGDFVFRNKDENGTEYLSIMFEMKNEADETKTKHKNEEFFRKLDEDRKKKGCEYAVLVSLLEADSDLYNSGIVDVSYAYPNMFVVRPQFFLPLIALLDKASKKSARALAIIEEEKRQNIDVENFESKLSEFQRLFAKHFDLAGEHYDKAIAEIDNAIAKLNNVRDELDLSRKQLRMANGNVQELSIKKLTKDSPSLAKKFEAIDAASDGE